MSRERQRSVEGEDEIGKRIKRERESRGSSWNNIDIDIDIDIDIEKKKKKNIGINNQNQNQNKEEIMGRRQMLLGPPAASLNTITPCAACKLLRRRCAEECPFCPYFSPHEPHKFAAVHKVFGASNVSKMLMEVGESQRADAANSLVYEANVRLRDPVYGCMGAISALQQQLQTLQAELHAVRAEILKHKYREAAANTLLSSTRPTNTNSSNCTSNNNSSASITAAPAAVGLPPPPPPPPSTPPLSASTSIVAVSSSSAASLYTSPPPNSHDTTTTTTTTAPGFPDNSLPFFD